MTTRRKRLPMTCQEWWPVRWGTKHEEADAEIMLGDVRLSEDFARMLDRFGWMIVIKPEVGAIVKWPMDPDYGPVPTWADDGSIKKPTLKIIDGGKNNPTKPDGDQI